MRAFCVIIILICSYFTHTLTSTLVQIISTAVSDLLPTAPQAFSSALTVGDQSFTDSTFYVPYLPFAPQQALSNIFTVLQKYAATLCTCSMFVVCISMALHVCTFS